MNVTRTNNIIATEAGKICLSASCTGSYWGTFVGKLACDVVQFGAKEFARSRGRIVDYNPANLIESLCTLAKFIFKKKSISKPL